MDRIKPVWKNWATYVLIAEAAVVAAIAVSCGASAPTDSKDGGGLNVVKVEVDGVLRNCVTLWSDGIDCDFTREAKP